MDARFRIQDNQDGDDKMKILLCDEQYIVQKIEDNYYKKKNGLFNIIENLKSQQRYQNLGKSISLHIIVIIQVEICPKRYFMLMIR